MESNSVSEYTPQTEAAIKNLVKVDYNYIQLTKLIDRYNNNPVPLDKIKDICTMDNKNAVDWKAVRKFFTEM